MRLNNLFQHDEMPVPRSEYNSGCFSFVWCVRDFDFVI